MAPVNGAPAKTNTRRITSKPVVPVLPLNYPQHPPVKQTSAPPNVKPSASAEAQPQHQVVEQEEERPSEGDEIDSKQDLAPENLNGSAASPAENAGSNTPSAVTSHIVVVSAAPADPSAPVIESAAASTGAPTVIAAPARHSVASPTPTRPSGSRIPPSNSNLYGPGPGFAHDLPVPTSQPAMAFRPAFHQAHPSNGSLVFGGFHDSNASSPAPHSGGGFPPPNIMAYPPVAALDAYGRPLLVSPTVDGYPPSIMNHHGPPTPHSFHGSQSSALADDQSMSHYPAINGHNGYHVDPAGHVPMRVPRAAPHMNGALHITNGSASVLQNLREQDDALTFLRSGVDDNAFTDCIIEMHFPDSPQFQDHPDYRRLRHMVRMPGHRFILSRSRTLAGAMKSQNIGPGGVVVLELPGEYMRSDVVCFSLRTLYGWPLGDGIPPSEIRLRDIRDDFKLALSYISAAQYFQLGWVHSASVERASRMLFWETIELAFNFVLPHIVARPRSDEYNLGVLLGHALGFIIKNFPKDFVLDVNPGDFGFSRLPALGPLHSPNTIAHGSSGGLHSRQPSNNQAPMSRGQRLATNPRLSQIKFGDISPPDRNGHGPAPQQPDAAQHRRAPSLDETILSRILLNLPYEFLKQVLEDPNLAGAPGELNPFVRHNIITEIIAEREARRLRTLEKSRPQLQFLQETLENAAAPLVVEQMGDFLVNNMGFKEEVCPGDLPFLVHTWTPSNSGSVSA